MDTDIVVGTESGMETILVLSGVTDREDIEKYPYKPDFVYYSIADMEVSRPPRHSSDRGGDFGRSAKSGWRRESQGGENGKQE